MYPERKDKFGEELCAVLIAMILFGIPSLSLIYYISIIPGYSRFLNLNGLVTHSLEQKIYSDDSLFNTRTTVYQTTFSIYDSYSNTSSCSIPKSETMFKLGKTYSIYLDTQTIDYLSHSGECYEFVPNNAVASFGFVVFFIPVIILFVILFANLYKYFCTNSNKKNNYIPVSQVEMV